MGQYGQLEAWQWGRGVDVGKEYGSLGSDLSCALTRWSRKFLALRLPKVTWVEGAPSRCQFSWSVSWKMVHDGWYVVIAKSGSLLLDGVGEGAGGVVGGKRRVWRFWVRVRMKASSKRS